MTAPRFVFSSDLNGTLVHEHTMSDMIRIYLGEEKFKIADGVFKRQTGGTATMKEAFGVAGPLTKGLTLRQAIEYVRTRMHFVRGFHEFTAFLRARNVPLIVNSTGYSVTIYAMQAMLGAGVIHGHIGNELRFGFSRSLLNDVLTENSLKRMVDEYIIYSRRDEFYGIEQATGDITLGIVDEAAKADLLCKYTAKHFPSCEPKHLIHMGDTMGDSGGIVGVARQGGIGIAFNYNKALEEFLRGQPKDVLERIHFVDPKSENADLRNVLPILEALDV